MSLQQAVAAYFPPPLLRILAAAVPVVIVCFFVARVHDKAPPPETMTPEAIAQRLQPVAVPVSAAADVAAAAPAAPLKGQAVYEATCVACHGAGIAGAPKFGDRKAWAPRIAQGYAVLVKHATEGFTGKGGLMPPKGGGDYQDLEIARAVAYMADQGGAKFPEPETLAKK